MLKWTLQRFHDTVMALLAGFMAGSLVKLWPWRVADASGLNDQWFSPAGYAAATGEDARLLLSLCTAVIAIILVALLHRLAPLHNADSRRQ